MMYTKACFEQLDDTVMVLAVELTQLQGFLYK